MDKLHRVTSSTTSGYGGLATVKEIVDGPNSPPPVTTNSSPFKDMLPPTKLATVESDKEVSIETYRSTNHNKNHQTNSTQQAAVEEPTSEKEVPVDNQSSAALWKNHKKDKRKLSLQTWICNRQQMSNLSDLDPDSANEETEVPVTSSLPSRWCRKMSLPPMMRPTTSAAATETARRPRTMGSALKHFKHVVFSSISNLNSGGDGNREKDDSSSRNSGISLPDLPHVDDDYSMINDFMACEGGDEHVARGIITGDLGGRDVEPTSSGGDSMIVALSALYCKLLVVIGLALPLSEVISPDIPPLFFHGFYLYLYGVSVVFLLFVYIFLLKDSVNSIDLGSSVRLNKLNSIRVSRSIGKMLRLDTLSSRSEGDLETGSQMSRVSHRRPYMVFVANYGSFYLRSGAVLFGIGSMIYSGLEFGQYFDVSHACRSTVMALTPALKLAFIFIQMYFVFLNASMSINKHKILGRFGLMHMVAANMCTWLNVVIEETKHELDHLFSAHPEKTDQTFYLRSNRHRRSIVNESISPSSTMTTGTTLNDSHRVMLNINREIPFIESVTTTINQTLHEGLHVYADNHTTNHTISGAYAHVATTMSDCGRDSIMGKLVNSVSPFLFPCSIEYSLICAATLYVMWKHLNKLNTVYVPRDPSGDRARKHHYSVDCASASKGLFMGILLFVVTVISLILFFVLINNPSSELVAIHSAAATELTLYTLTSIAIVIGMIQVQKLTYHPNRNMELDNILLVAAQTGVFLYAVFNIIGAYFMSDVYSLATGIMSIIQVNLQTMFILDTTHRQAFTTKQVLQKPGREVVTFLLISNLAMWATNTFETSRSDAHPEQLHFYGFWAWTVISHVSMPLAIFYRFHCTVCLCEIWKKAYKQKTIA